MENWDDETGVTELARLVRAGDGQPTLVVIAGESIGEAFRLRAGTSVIGRARDADLRLDDDGVSRAHARIEREGSEVTIEDLESRNGTWLNGVRLTGPVRIDEGDKIQLGHTSIVKFTRHDALDDSFQRQMYEAALRDGMTHLFNKRYFRARLESELRFAARHRSDLGVVMLDLDHFKRVNDTYGHLVGDEVLVAVSRALARALRTEDVVARWGGEEFAVLLRGIAPDHVRVTADRLRRIVEGLEVPREGGDPVRVTVSAGIATYPATAAMSPDELVEVADRALYTAKREGRNRIAG